MTATTATLTRQTAQLERLRAEYREKVHAAQLAFDRLHCMATLDPRFPAALDEARKLSKEATQIHDRLRELIT